TFATPFGRSSWTTTGCALCSRNTLTINAAAPARTSATTPSMITDGLMEKQLLFPRKFCNADLCECPLSDPMLGTHGEGLVNFPGSVCLLLTKPGTAARRACIGLG